MKLAMCVVAAVFAMLLAGCEAVYVEQPVGEEPVTLDPAVWQGIWLADGAAVVTTVLDAEKGMLQAAWVERRAEGASFEVVTGQVRHSGDSIFFSALDKPEEDEEENAAAGKEPAPAVPKYYFALVDNNGERAIVWWPHPEAMRAAVRAGRIPGVAEDEEDVRLGTLSAEHLALIVAPEQNLLSWTMPLVFVRTAD